MIEGSDLLTEGEKETLMRLALAGEPWALGAVRELSRPTCKGRANASAIVASMVVRELSRRTR